MTSDELLKYFTSAVGGALVTFVAFRTKLALMDRRIESRKTEIANLDATLTRKLSSIERKQTLLLEIMANVANKVGVDKRFSDIIIQFLADDAENRS